VDRLDQDKKWAEKLSSQCGLSEAFLKDVLQELSESCFGDAKTSKDIIEELTLSCHLDEKELRMFLDKVSKNCPFDAEKLKEIVAKAQGSKKNLFESIDVYEGSRGPADRGGVK
jgi:hypothetical protein